VTRFISKNYAALGRAVYLGHPLAAVIGHFSGGMQSEAIHRTEGQLLFDPRMRGMHDFKGWLMRVDIRRNCGYGTVIVRPSNTFCMDNLLGGVLYFYACGRKDNYKLKVTGIGKKGLHELPYFPWEDAARRTLQCYQEIARSCSSKTRDS
jgi:hypothetical protein